MENKLNPKGEERRDASSTTWSDQDNIRERTYDWHQRISWGAIIAGTIVAIFIHLCLSLLGLGIGFSTVNGDNVNGQALAAGSAIWYIISMLVSVFAGGWVAGRLAKDKHVSESIIHGVLVTGLMVILSLYLLSSAVGRILGGATFLLSSTVSATAPIIQERMGYRDGLNNMQDTLSQQDKTALKNKAEQMARDVAKGASRGALYAFLGLLLSGVAGGWGAKMGRDSKDKMGYEGVGNRQRYSRS